MKKKIFIALYLTFFISLFTFNVFAAQGFDFKLEYEGNIIQNVEKNANVLLVGSSATQYNNVRIKVDIKGPSTPTVLAKDTSGVEHDIIKLGYWGPPSGFAVGGNFSNTTPIRAKFTETGKYNLTLSLVDVSNSESVITSEYFEINVLSNTPPVEDEEVTELPQTGIGILEYTLYSLVIIAIILTAILLIKKNKQKE